MRIVFALTLAGAMVNTGYLPAVETQFDRSIGTLRLASLDLHDSKIADRFPVPPEPAHLDLASTSPVEDRYPLGEDAMNDSMIKTNRSVLAMPVPDVPIDKLCQALASAAEEHNLPVPFFARLIWQESRFRQSAVSPVGAQGVAQFMPQTAAAYGLENPFDPIHALTVSARFLRELRDTFGNLGLAAAAYNGGSGRVQNWLARRAYLPEETRNYVKTITGHEPETWAVASESVDLAADLPRRAPCEGTAGLARGNGPLAMPVMITGWVHETLRKAEEAAVAAREAAAAAAVKMKLLARAKGSRKSAATKAMAASATPSKHNTVVVAGRRDVGKVASKAGRPSLVIAVIAADKPVKAAAKAGGTSIATKFPAKSRTVSASPGKASSEKPIRLVDARGSR
jgi:hypothetical protein